LRIRIDYKREISAVNNLKRKKAVLVLEKAPDTAFFMPYRLQLRNYDRPSSDDPQGQ